MTRLWVYLSSAAAFVGVAAMTLASIITPEWIQMRGANPSKTPNRWTYGLHKQCSFLLDGCVDFPVEKDCSMGNRHFCTSWRSIGFLLNFAVVLELMTLVAFIVILWGGVQKRAQGWGVLSGLLSLVATALGAGMSVCAYVYNHDDRFIDGFELWTSWYLCLAGFIVSLLLASGIVASAYLLESEGGYELIPDSEQSE